MKLRHAPLPLLLTLTAASIPFVPSSGRADEDDDSQDDPDSDEGNNAPKRAAPPMPQRIDICITSAVIAPTKGDGSPWDIGAKLTEDERKAAMQLLLAAAKKAPPLIPAAIAGVFMRPAVQALDKPDVYGSVQLAPRGAYGGQSASKLNIAARGKPVREFLPNFGELVCFKDAPWSAEMRLRVDLTDEDLVNDDKIATVEIVSKNVADAFANGKALHVYVGDQDTGQLSYVILNVTKADEEE